MRKIIFILCCFILLYSKSNAQSPSWTVVQSNFQYTMTFLGFFNIDGVVLSSTNDKIGAFVNGECRGTANLIYEASQQRYYAYLTVFANSEADVVTFKVFDATKNVVKDITKTVPFVINNHYGSLLQAFCFANTTLSSSAELLDLNYTNAKRKTFAINGTNVNISIDKVQDLSALITTFIISPNSTVFLNGVKITSGVTPINFYAPVVLRVRSQDESVVKDWTIKLAIPVLFYKKNVVCYAKGAIKVDCPINGESVSLSVNGQQILTQTIVNFTTTFGNLNAGVYTVTALGETKTISILKL